MATASDRGGLHACNCRNAIQDLAPVHSFIARRVEFSAARAEVDTGRSQGVGSHAVPKHGLVSVLLWHSRTEGFPGPARIFRAINPDLSLRPDPHLPFQREDVGRVGIVRMRDHREAEVRRNSIAYILPAITGVIAAEQPAMILQI